MSDVIKNYAYYKNNRIKSKKNQLGKLIFDRWYSAYTRTIDYIYVSDRPNVPASEIYETHTPNTCAMFGIEQLDDPNPFDDVLLNQRYQIPEQRQDQETDDEYFNEIINRHLSINNMIEIVNIDGYLKITDLDSAIEVLDIAMQYYMQCKPSTGRYHSQSNAIPEEDMEKMEKFIYAMHAAFPSILPTDYFDYIDENEPDKFEIGLRLTSTPETRKELIKAAPAVTLTDVYLGNNQSTEPPVRSERGVVSGGTISQQLVNLPRGI